MMCNAGFDLSQALECSDGCGVKSEMSPQHPFKREGSLCDLHSGIKLEVTLHPHNMRQVANLIITMHRIKNNQRLKGTEFSDQELLNIMLESVVEECVVRDVADQTQSSDTVFTSTSRMEECNVCDQYQKSLVLHEEALELQAMWLQGGTFSHRVRLNLSTYVSPSLPGGSAQPVALGIAGTNLYLSCSVKQETPILQLEEVNSSSKLKIISAQADMARFLFFKRGSALTMTSFESAKYNGWFISTAMEDGERVDMCTTQDSSRLTSFMVKQV
uniref:Interleukin-1 n=1 Tax=Paramormyrops kingsleyae TaxID=1676925 RepID=A0A3B3S9R4_9TELE|nr:interleukin-1 beta-like [Paramormyrops kingsleyae]XP_023682202.1 interleukin-1 beta-like [Paramormyrops kingsleyae]